MEQKTSKPTLEWFEDWFNSPYYPLLYNHRNEEEAHQFVTHILDYLELPSGARILDLACGKGRLARQLAAQDFQVIGLDIAPNAIAWAQQFEKENLSFFTHDMRLPFRINYFDAVFNFFTSFGYFDNDTDHYNSLLNVRRGLRSGGRFVLDFLNTPRVLAELVEENERVIDKVRFVMKRRFEQGHFYKDIFIFDGEKRWHYQEKVRGFTLAEFETLFAKAGLVIESTFGDYQLGSYDSEQSNRLILVASKKED